MAIGDKIAIADKPTLDVVKTNTDTLKTSNAQIQTDVNTVIQKLDEGGSTGTVEYEDKVYEPILSDAGISYHGIKNIRNLSASATCITSDDDYIYVGHSTGEIIKYDKLTLKRVASMTHLVRGMNFIIAVDDFLIVNQHNNTDGRIYRLRKSNLSVMNNITGIASSVQYMVADSTHIYFMFGTLLYKTEVSASTLAGSTTFNIGATPTSMAMDNTHLFIGTTAARVNSYSKDTLVNTKNYVVSSAFNVGVDDTCIYAGSDTMYIYDKVSGSLYGSVDPNGGTMNTMTTSKTSIFTAGGLSHIKRYTKTPVTGAKADELINLMSLPSSIYVDDMYVYALVGGNVQIFNNASKVVGYKEVVV